MRTPVEPADPRNQRSRDPPLRGCRQTQRVHPVYAVDFVTIDGWPSGIARACDKKAGHGIYSHLLGDQADRTANPATGRPRIGLSAHLTAVQSGTALLAIGWFWPQLAEGNAYADLLGHALWISFWMLSAGLTLAAAWGASKVLPIAVVGYTATPLRERVTAGVILVSSVAMILALGALLAMNVLFA